jgi:hypothetical protein
MASTEKIPINKDAYSVSSKKSTILLLLIQLACINNTVANSVNASLAIKDALCEIKPFGKSNMNKNASLSFQMTLKQHISGTAYAIDFELSNNTNRNVVILAPSDIRELFTIVIFNSNRQEISQKLKSYAMDSPEKRQYGTFALPAGAKKNWTVNFKAVLQESESVKQQLAKGSEDLLIMNFMFSYIVDAPDCDKQYKKAKMGKYIENVHCSLES